MTANRTVEEYAIALRESRGMVTTAARRLGVSYQAVSQRIAKHPTLQAVRDEAREAMTDTAEEQLYDKIQAGESWAISFYLRTQGRGRGYVERTEHTTPPGEPFEVVVQPRPWHEILTPFLPDAADDERHVS